MAQHVATKVAVVGAGYAGLACAVELASAGLPVDVFEASRTLGGRARAVEIDGVTLDNGAHILVGAYRETLRLISKVSLGETASADEPRTARTALRRESLRLEFPGHVKVAAPRLPSPLHLAWALLTAQGLSFGEKFAALRFMRAQQKRHFRLPGDMSTADLLAAHRQPERVCRFLWEPLCLAALNTPVAIASAQVFLNVLRDSLAAESAASDLLLPATDFSTLFPEPAARFIEAQGGRVQRATRIHALTRTDAGWHVDLNGPYDHLVLAVAPYHLPKLLSPHPAFAALLRQVASFTWQPIVTCYLAYPARALLPFPMVGLDTAEGGHAQWLFDRGALCGQSGILAAVISGEGPHQVLSHAALGEAIHAEIAALLPGLPAPRHTWVIEEKRATFACAPGLERPPTATADPTVWLAGDYVAGDYPATLEGAVRSGVAAARAILDLKLQRSVGLAPGPH